MSEVEKEEEEASKKEDTRGKIGKNSFTVLAKARAVKAEKDPILRPNVFTRINGPDVWGVKGGGGVGGGGEGGGGAEVGPRTLISSIAYSWQYRYFRAIPPW